MGLGLERAERRARTWPLGGGGGGGSSMGMVGCFE